MDDWVCVVSLRLFVYLQIVKNNYDSPQSIDYIKSIQGEIYDSHRIYQFCLLVGKNKKKQINLNLSKRKVKVWIPSSLITLDHIHSQTTSPSLQAFYRTLGKIVVSMNQHDYNRMNSSWDISWH